MRAAMRYEVSEPSTLETSFDISHVRHKYPKLERNEWLIQRLASSTANVESSCYMPETTKGVSHSKRLANSGASRLSRVLPMHTLKQQHLHQELSNQKHYTDLMLTTLMIWTQLHRSLQLVWKALMANLASCHCTLCVRMNDQVSVPIVKG